ncbi:hypothetical protein AH04_184 [Erwinia phage AH04]|uniref:Uncharacterized protein n=1 Tax=Erwinia phage AH04 TaxID=2869569 RepID=A0AAE7X1N6_9CAUD|nr:hypothetical protein PQC02_gp130 [Erwinia phage AH04]QZA70659.1 hypothetical protein AH04_184 [Erwinia phage AH04]
MAKPKKVRTKKFNPNMAMSHHVAAALNSAINKFYIIGDMNHDPMSFHTSQVNMTLKGLALKIGLQEMTKFFYKERRNWMFAVYHFFKVDGKMEVVPSIMRIEDALLNEVADAAEENIQLLKDSIIGTDEGLTEENYVFYGYYINYEDGLRMDLMEDDIINSLFKVNNDFEEIKPEVRTCTAEKVLRAIAGEKFSLANSHAIKTNMIEEIA